jgi:hypothetical protein
MRVSYFMEQKRCSNDLLSELRVKLFIVFAVVFILFELWID